MTAGAWAGLAVAAWNLLWAWAVWRREAAAALAFRKHMANRYPHPWE